MSAYVRKTRELDRHERSGTPCDACNGTGVPA